MRRIDAAQAALAAYVGLVAGEYGEPMDTQLADLVADLMHLAHAEGFEWGEIESRAVLYVAGDMEDAAAFAPAVGGES